jgi:ribosomal protein S18 acetylase RimI-like enzyme
MILNHHLNNIAILFIYLLNLPWLALSYRVTRPYSLCHTTSRANKYFALFAAFESKLEYRNARISDLSAIAKLCVDTFDNDTPWYQPFARKFKEEQQYAQFLSRYEQIQNGYQHAMIVCYDADDLVGFTEIGMLPPPRQAIDKEPSLTASSENTSESESDGDNMPSSSLNGDVPYLGNVAVDKSYRR